MNELETDPATFELLSPPPTAPADAALAPRVDQTLARLDELLAWAGDDGRYQAEPRGFDLPEGFLLSVVIPVYNEQHTIGQLVARVLWQPFPLEVIVVDDASTDGTAAVLGELVGLPGVRVVHKPRNAGKGAALRTGFHLATGDVVVVQDADLEYDPRELAGLVRPIVQGQADVVYGSRFAQRRHRGSSRIHRLGNWLLTVVSNLVTGLRLSDMETGYKAFRREVLAGLEIEQERFGFEPEVTAKIARRGCRVFEVPIAYHARGWDQGKKIGLKDALSALYCILRYAWRD